ncbi:unnamed protein product [Allacma fusca]|uniref:Uncharacterized protein n=1 Tax=Allacma fusca TaxID=39272 RepID=A0A8J2KDN9_9HEXA|nr:unnamed protein product [Allacma fusca]
MFLLVEWINDRPKTWTVVSTYLLAEGQLRNSKKLVGKIVAINWKKRQHPALVINAGTDEYALETEADQLAATEADQEINQSKPSTPVPRRKRRNLKNISATDSNSVGTDSRNLKRMRMEERLDQIDTVLNDCGGSTDSIPDTLQSTTHDVTETEVIDVADHDGL